MSETTVGPELLEFGPVSVAGLTYRGNNANDEIAKVWRDELMPRFREISKPAHDYGAYGICRCIPGATDGTFEYIAGFETADSENVPAGMVCVQLPAARYASFVVNGLADVKHAWSRIQPWLHSQTKWQSYCTGPDECECANHPSFEYYPPEFQGDGTFFIYVPVREKP